MTEQHWQALMSELRRTTRRIQYATWFIVVWTLAALLVALWAVYGRAA